MQKDKQNKIFFYFDESGDPNILGHHGVNLLREGKCSKTFSVGFISTQNPHEIQAKLENLRKELIDDATLKAEPSIANLKNGFHANKDCAEVRREVFKLLKTLDFETYVIVARKDVQQPSHTPLLQVIDYVLWTIFRFYEKGETRYMDFMKEKIKIVNDIFAKELEDIKNETYGG